MVCQTYPSERFKVAFSLAERASTGTLSGSEIAGALTLVLRVCTGILFESIKYIYLFIFSLFKVDFS